MALEDLFKVVKDRFKEDSGAEKQSSSVDIPKGLLFKCPRCRAVSYKDEFDRNKGICLSCGYHSRISYRERLEYTVDKDTFEEFDADMRSVNPIGFPDYEEKVKELQEKCDMKDAIVTGLCRIHDFKVVIGIMDSNFMMASMGSVVGEKITRAFEYATEHKLPVVLFTFF